MCFSISSSMTEQLPAKCFSACFSVFSVRIGRSDAGIVVESKAQGTSIVTCSFIQPVVVILHHAGLNMCNRGSLHLHTVWCEHLNEFTLDEEICPA